MRLDPTNPLHRSRPGNAVPNAALLLAAAGLVAPASAVTRDWIGPDHSFFNVVNSWSPAGVPNLNDTARFGVNGVANKNVWMPTLASVQDLRVENGMTLHLLGGNLYVQDDAVFKGRNRLGITYFPSQIRVTESGDPWDVWVQDGLTVQEGARIEMLGGIVQVDGQLVVDADSAITGHGTVRLRLDNPGVVAARFGGRLDPNTDGITIEMTGDSPLDLDGSAENGVLALDGRTLANPAAYDRLTIVGDRLAETFDGVLQMVSGARLEMNLAMPWTAGPNSLIAVTTPLPATQPARITGADVTLYGELTVSGEHSEARFESDATIFPSFTAGLGPTTRLRFLGGVRIHGGAFGVGEDAAVVFGGETEWRGAASFTGLATQDGDARVTQATTIDAEEFDLDGGGGGTHWDLDARLEINADAIERSAGSVFDGSMRIGSGVSTALEINLPPGAPAWVMSGTMNLHGEPVTPGTRLRGSPVRFEGAVDVADRVRVAAPVTFGNLSTTTIPGGASLQIGDEGVVRANATFQGSGELQTSSFGSLLLHDGASLGPVGLRNYGALRIADGPGGAAVDRFIHPAWSEWHIEIGGHAPIAEHDALLVTGGAATIGGELHVELIDGFVPAVGDAFTILTSPAGGVGGSVSSVPPSQAGDATVHWTIAYAPNSVSLHVAEIEQCQADFDGDGALGVTDLLAFLGAFRGGAASADVDGAGGVDVADLLAYLGLFRSGC